jgi:2-dehydropantoate 2-reductase
MGEEVEVQFAIWGAGAVGIGLASTLARREERVQILGRDPETCHALARHGIMRTGLFGTRVVPPEQLMIETDPRSLAENPPHWLLICTKAFATPAIADALEGLAPALGMRTRLLLCQNGWGNERPFARFWPTNRLFHARIITGFHRRSPHEVEITAHASPIALGSVFGEATGSLVPVATQVSEGGVPAHTTEDMRAVLWAKMLYNCALNPLGALAGQRYGDLTDNPRTRRVVDEVIREIFRVLDSARISVPWANADAYLETFHGELIPATSAHESSMLQDLRAGRPTEIEALCGAVERLGAASSIETPVVSALAELVRAAERAQA